MAKERTPTQKKKLYKRVSYACFGGEFVAAASPFVAIGIANYDKYFIQYDGTKMSVAAFMGLGLMGFAIWLIAKKKFENSFITLIVGWATAATVITLLGQLVNDLSTIMWFGLIGIAGAYGLDIGSKQAERKANEIQKGIDRAKEEMTAEAYKEEVRKVKVKVKK